MKNEKKYMGFLIPKVWQILKRFAGIFSSSTNLLFLKSGSENSKIVRLFHEAYFCNVPMYSSFSKDKIFPRQPGDKFLQNVAGDAQ